MTNAPWELDAAAGLVLAVDLTVSVADDKDDAEGSGRYAWRTVSAAEDKDVAAGSGLAAGITVATLELREEATVGTLLACLTTAPAELAQRAAGTGRRISRTVGADDDDDDAAGAGLTCVAAPLKLATAAT